MRHTVREQVAILGGGGGGGVALTLRQTNNHWREHSPLFILLGAGGGGLKVTSKHDIRVNGSQKLKTFQLDVKVDKLLVSQSSAKCTG